MDQKTKSCSLGGACGAGAVGILCPLCLPAVAGLLSSIGLGFVVAIEVILPVLGLLILLFIVGLASGYRRHGRMAPFILGVIGVLAIPAGNYILMSRQLTYLGAGVAIAAAMWNIALGKQRRTPDADHGISS